MKYSYILLVFALILISCKSDRDPRKIVDRSIKVHGGEKYRNSSIEFDFRNKHYKSTLTNGLYKYERIFRDSSSLIHDILTNEGFSREIDGKQIKITQEWARRYSNSINSVIYFTLLPYGLNDAAVILDYIDMVTIKGQSYHKIRVTFTQQGGGEDFEDRFIYWINTDTYTMDYIGYLYYSDGGGIRFRSVSNVNNVNGIRFQDYENHELADLNADFECIDRLYETNNLNFLSEIKNENIQVK